MKRLLRIRCALILFFGVVAAAATDIAAGPTVSDKDIPGPAGGRVDLTQVRVRPDRTDWTYAPGEHVTFRVDVVCDRQPLVGATVYHFASGEFGGEVLGRDIFDAAEVRRRKRELRDLLRFGLVATAGR